MIRRALERAAYGLRDKAAREIQNNGRVTDVDLQVLMLAAGFERLSRIGRRKEPTA